MKNISLLLLICLYAHFCSAQGVFSNQTNNALEKVVKDYHSQFKNIRGELLSSSSSSSEYASNITVPGSVSTVITQSAEHKSAVSWQSVLYTDKNFSSAKGRFEELFNQIKNTIIKPDGGKAVIVNGMYIDPVEEKISTVIQFDLLPPTGDMQQVNIALALKHTGKQWNVLLFVYDKDLHELESLTAR